MNTNTRIYFMDPLRGILMALGVVLHAGQVFNPENTWLIHSSQTTPLAELIINFVHIFRMPAFYIVSGFFALFTLRKYGASLFLKLRTEKILIPFVATALTLNSLQAWLLSTSRNEAFNFAQYFMSGEWVAHLWFLGYLFAYVVVMYAAALVLQPKDSSVNRNILAGRNTNSLASSASGNGLARTHSDLQTAAATSVLPLTSRIRESCQNVPVEVMLLVLPFYYIALVITAKLVPALYAFRFGFSLYDFLNYFQFFAFGIAICWSPSLFSRFTKISLVKTAVLIGLWLVVSRFEHSVGETFGKVIEAYSRFLLIWISCHIVFSFFKTLADRPSKIASFMSSVSYTVYLFHHSLVIVFGLLFIQLGLGGVPGFVMLTTVVAILGVAIHVFLIARYNWASYLFNGVRLHKKSPSVAGFTPVQASSASVAVDA